MPGLATICVLFSHKANGEKAHKYRLCRHLPSYIGLGLKIVSRLCRNKGNFSKTHNNNKIKPKYLKYLTISSNRIINEFTLQNNSICYTNNMDKTALASFKMFLYTKSENAALALTVKGGSSGCFSFIKAGFPANIPILPILLMFL